MEINFFSTAHIKMIIGDFDKLISLSEIIRQ